MKLKYVFLLMSLAGLFALSDPYGLVVAGPQRKQKNIQVTDTLVTNPGGKGSSLRIEFIKGAAHNHPLFAVWAEDTSGNYIQTLYVSTSIATSTFNFGEQADQNWQQGVVRRPAALPYWAHKKGVVAEDGLYMPMPDSPVPDAYSGATPKNSFVLKTHMDQPGPRVFNILMELNQPWDWNAFWTNNKYPDDEDYKASSQPAVVYKARIDISKPSVKIPMELIGHSHYSGKDGSLNKDVSTLTTALEIAEKITIIPAE